MTTPVVSASRAGLGSVIVDAPRGFIVGVGIVPGVADLPATPTGLVVDDDVFFAPAIANTLVVLSIVPALYSDDDSIYAPSISQVLSAGLATDADAFYSPAIALDQRLSPAPVFDADVFLADAVGQDRLLRPALLADPDTIIPAFSVVAVQPGKDQKLHAGRLNSDDVIFAARFPLSPSALVLDLDTIFAPSIFASYGLQAPFVVDADATYAPFAAMLAQPGLVTDTESIYRPTLSLFLKPELLDDIGVVPAADVGWQVIARFTNDDEAIFVPVEAMAYNELFADVLVEDDVIDTYPFYIQGIVGGTPLPPSPEDAGGGALTGSLSQPRRLTGSLSNRKPLSGSVSNQGGLRSK